MSTVGEAVSTVGEAASTVGEAAFKPMIPLGQFRDTFIIAVDDEGIAIVDQHVAHERVLFERVMERLTKGRLESQRLLVPLVLEFSSSACQTLAARSADLEAFGFEIEEFGDSTHQGLVGAGAVEHAMTARRRCGRSPRISKASTAGRTSSRRCSASRRPRPVTRQ